MHNSTSVQPIQDKVHDSTNEVDASQQQQQYNIATGRERRQIRPPQRFVKADLVAYASYVAEVIEYHEPSNYREVVSSENSAQWSIAMSEEIESLHKNQTCELVKPPKGQKIVGCKWVFKKKEGTTGVEASRFKA